VWNFFIDFLENAEIIDSFGLSSVGMNGSQGGYTIVNFIVIYIVGAYIRLYKNEKYDSKKVLLVAIVTLFVMFGMSICEHKMGYDAIITWNYYNPLLVLLSACWIILFKSIHLKSRIINELAKGAFTCFLIHGFFIQYLKIEDFINAQPWILVIHMLVSAVCLYLIAYVVYKVYSLCTKPITSICDRFLDRINISVDINND